MTQLANLTEKTDWKQDVLLEYKKTKQRKEMMKMANAKTKKQRNDNKSNQKNPNNWRYHKSRKNNN